MKLVTFSIVALCWVTPLWAQQPAATPPPLPPRPWLKRAPVPSQWLISYAIKTKADAKNKEASQPPADISARKTVAVSKAADVISEVTTRWNGSILRHWKSGSLYLAQVGNSNQWISCPGGPENSFYETNYANSDFAGFNWISEKNYTGIVVVDTHPCLVFRDKVISLESREIEDIKTSTQMFITDWQARQDALKAKPGKPPVIAEPAPRPFNIEDYKVAAEATIDSVTGMPVMLSYQTDRGNETRTYQILPPPTTPLTLPLEAQKLVAEAQAQSKRLLRPAVMP